MPQALLRGEGEVGFEQRKVDPIGSARSRAVRPSSVRQKRSSSGGSVSDESIPAAYPFQAVGTIPAGLGPRRPKKLGESGEDC